MITFTNFNANPFSVQYVHGSQSFRKEILPNNIVGFRNLTTISQITNLQALKNENITVYDYINNAYSNQGAFLTGFRGTVSQSGLTLTTPFMVTSTGWTITTTAATANDIALNTAVANGAGNTYFVKYSGASVSTNVWLAALAATSFSSSSISVIGGSDTNYVSSGSSKTITLTGDTASSNVSTANSPYTTGSFLYVGDAEKREQYVVAAPYFNITTGYTSLQALVTGSTFS